MHFSATCIQRLEHRPNLASQNNPSGQFTHKRFGDDAASTSFLPFFQSFEPSFIRLDTYTSTETLNLFPWRIRLSIRLQGRADSNGNYAMEIADEKMCVVYFV